MLNDVSMHEPRQIVSGTIDFEGTERSRLLNRCLLLTVLLLAVGLAVIVGLSGMERLLRFSLPHIAVGSIGALWLLAVYLLGRWHRLQIAGGLFVALALAGFAAALCLFPVYALLLLPFGALPAALSALLLSRPAVYVVAVLTVLAGGVGLIAPGPGVVVLPPVEPAIVLAAFALSMLLVAFVLGLMRGTLTGLAGRLGQVGEARQQVDAERQGMQQALAHVRDYARLRQQHLEILVDSIEDGLIAVDASGRLVRANRVARELWASVSNDDLIGQPFEVLRRMLGRANEEERDIDVVALPTQSQPERGDYTHVVLDRRERVRLARLRNELLSLLSDEMRNPLLSMVTALDLTLAQHTLPEDVARVLFGARGNGQRLIEIVSTLLDIDQLEQNPSVLRRSSISLCRVLEAGVAQMTPLAQQGAVTVAVEYSNDCLIRMDGEHMQRAFMHLLEYALRRSPPYSTIEVRTERQNGAVLVRVTDQGAGLSPQQRVALFDRRVALNERAGPVLGLFFSKLVIELHGGQLAIESDGVQGMRYSFLLPVEDHEHTIPRVFHPPGKVASKP